MLTLEEIKPCNKVRNLDHRNKITGIISIKILMNKTHQNCFLDSSCKLTVMMPEMMPQVNFVKISF